MSNKLRELKGETKLKFHKIISKYYDNMNIRMDGDTFAKNVQGTSKINHEVLMVMKYLQTKPEVRSMNINYYDLYYTVIKNRHEKEIVGNQYENVYIKFNDFFIPNHNPRDTFLR